MARSVRVVTENAAVDRAFDYEVSDAFAAATANLPEHEPRITQAGDGPMPARPPFRAKMHDGKGDVGKPAGGKPFRGPRTSSRPLVPRQPRT